MANIFLFSDPHFFHQGIYKFTYKDASGVERRVRERFQDVKEGDAYMIQRWAELVKPNDHIWVLGDLCMYEGNHMGHELVKLIKPLPGHKRLILGNHDKLNMRWYIDCGFQKIRGSNLLDGILLTHFPTIMAGEHGRVIHNIHGHLHQNSSPSPRVRQDGKVNVWENVSVERTDYQPISLEDIKKRIKDATEKES